MQFDSFLLFMAAICFLGAAGNLLFTRQAIALDKWFMPEKIFLLVEQKGLTTARVVRIVGWFAFGAGMVCVLSSIFLLINRMF